MFWKNSQRGTVYGNNGFTVFFSFLFFSVLGWAVETAYRSFSAKRFINPGLLKGPYLILYGAAALILMFAVPLLQGFPLIVRAAAYMSVITGIELVSGIISRYFFQKRLWDYSNEKFNYRGYICLKFTVFWVLIAFAFEYFILPAYLNLIALLPNAAVTLSVWIMSAVISADILFTAVRSSKHGDKHEIDKEFGDMSEPILNMPEVLLLAQYNHHRSKTRLEHVLEVAYISFLISKKFNLDSAAVVKGALLHDLFYYDWRTEGPRLHGFRHHTIAFRNAEKITELSEKEADIIKKHMWPLTVVPPFYMESLLVCFVDTYCSAKDYMPSMKNGRRYFKNK